MDQTTEKPTYDKPAILKKFAEEKLSAIKARQIRIQNWLDDEKAYNGVTTPTLLTRSNLHIPKTFEAVQTTSSKIGKLPTIEFDTKPEGDENSTEIMHALWNEDIVMGGGADVAKDSKIEAGIYGRTIYKLIPSNDGATVELVDTMSFLINPTAKGTTKGALYCGQQFIYKTIPEIEAETKDFGYDQTEIDRLKADKVASETAAATSNSEEKTLKDLRLSYLGYANVTQLGEKMVELNEWYTYIDKILHVLTVANDKYLLRVVPATDTGLPKNRNPYNSWATYPRRVVFWTPSVADIVRDPNLAMDVSMNQLIDNNTYRNFGMLFVSTASGLKQSSLIPRPLGVTAVSIPADQSVKDHVWQFTPPEITSANATIQTLNTIAENSAGLTAAPLGQKGKMSVTQQAGQAELVSGKGNLMKEDFVRCWQDVAQLFADVVSTHLTNPRKVKIYGYKQVTLEGVTRANFKDVEFIAKATAAESSSENKAIKQKASSALYEMFKDDPKIPGQTYLRERVAKDFDMTASEIDKLFTADKGIEGETEAAPVAPPIAPAAGAGDAIPENPENPQLSANAQATAAVVPPAIR